MRCAVLTLTYAIVIVSIRKAIIRHIPCLTRFYITLIAMPSIRKFQLFLICLCFPFLNVSFAATKNAPDNNYGTWDGQAGYSHKLDAAPPIVRNIGNILYIGDGHEALVNATGDTDTNPAPAGQRVSRGPVSGSALPQASTFCTFGWHYCDVFWMWHLHRILVDNGIKYRFIGADQFFVPTGSNISFKSNKVGYLADQLQKSHTYRGVPFYGKALTSYGRRASEISGRTSIYDRYQELPHIPNKASLPRSHGDLLKYFKTTLAMSGELDLDEGHIRHWLGLEKKPLGIFSLPPDEIPDIAILRVGLQDLLNDTMKQSQRNDYKMGSKSDFQKATQRLLGNSRKAVSSANNNRAARGSRKINYKHLGDMEIIVNALREKNPQIRILVLPLAMYSHELIFRGQYVHTLFDGKNKGLDYIGKTKKGLTALHKELNNYNEKLKVWCAEHGVKYLNIPEVHQTWPGEKGNFLTAKWYLVPPRSINHETAYRIARAIGVPGGASLGFPRKSTQELKPCKDGKYPDGLQDALKNGYTLVYRYENIDAEFRTAVIVCTKTSKGPELRQQWVWKNDMYIDMHIDSLSHSDSLLPSSSRHVVTNSGGSADHEEYQLFDFKSAGKIIYIAYSTEGCFAPALSKKAEVQLPAPESKE